MTTPFSLVLSISCSLFQCPMKMSLTWISSALATTGQVEIDLYDLVDTAIYAPI